MFLYLIVIKLISCNDVLRTLAVTQIITHRLTFIKQMMKQRLLYIFLTVGSHSTTVVKLMYSFTPLHVITYNALFAIVYFTQIRKIVAKSNSRTLPIRYSCLKPDISTDNEQWYRLIKAHALKMHVSLHRLCPLENCRR